MGDKDFRVGDIVCCYTWGTGEVSKVTESEVTFEYQGGSVMFKPDGSYLHTLIPDRPQLFHGTWEEVFGNVKDVKLIRKVKRWVNIYPDGLYDRFTSKAKAEENVSEYRVLAIAIEIEIEEDKL